MKSVIKTLLLLFPLFASAQKAPNAALISRLQADSLRNVTHIEKNDTLIMQACRSLGFYYYENNYDSAMYFLQESHKLAKKLRLKMWEADGYSQIGGMFIYQGNITKAYEYLLESKALADDEKNENSNWHTWNFSNAQNLHAARTAILSDIHNSFGVFYEQIGEREKSNKAYYEAIRLGEIIDSKILLSLAYGNLARNYTTDTLILFSKKAIQYGNEAGFQTFRGLTLSQIAGAYLNKNQYDSAVIYGYAAMAADQAQNNLYTLSQEYSGFAIFYNRIRKIDSSMLYAEKLLSLAGSTKNRKIDLLAYSTLGTIYGSIKYIDSAYKYEHLSNFLNDSLKNVRIKQLTNYQNFAFNEQLRLQQINDEKTAYQNKLKLYSVIGGLAVMLFVAVILFRNNRQKHKANHVLETTLTQLKSSQQQLIQSEKMASLGELTAGIAHEIQNPLNFVNNFSEVNKELIVELKDEIKKGNIEEVNAIADDIEANEEKINHHGKRADAIVKGMLQHSRSNSGQKEPTDINALADEYLRLAYHGLRAKDKSFNAALQTDYDETIGNINIIPQDIGRVILNLITNAFYAVDEKKKQADTSYEPTVSVSTKKVLDKIEIKVSDNGDGIPQNIINKIFQPFFTTKPTGQGTGLGLSLAYDIVKAHGGELRVSTEENEGTTFIIRLPFK